MSDGRSEILKDVVYDNPLKEVDKNVPDTSDNTNSDVFCEKYREVLIPVLDRLKDK